MTLAVKPSRAPNCPPFFRIPLCVQRGPPFGGSFEQRDCTTSAVMNGRTDEIADIATTTAQC